jgi:hypothetical protein
MVFLFLLTISFLGFFLGAVSHALSQAQKQLATSEAARVEAEKRAEMADNLRGAFAGELRRVNEQNRELREFLLHEDEAEEEEPAQVETDESWPSVIEG